jgi:leucyl aminopeptidase
LKNITFKLTSASEAQTVIIPLLDNEQLAKNLEHLSKQTGIPTATLANDFKAQKKETLMVYATQNQPKKVYLVGLGKAASSAECIAAIRSFFYKNKAKIGVNPFVIDLKTGNTEHLAEYISNGFFLANYEISHLKTSEKSVDLFSALTEITILASSERVEILAKSLKIGKMIAETQLKNLRLVDLPANYKTPQNLAEFAIESGKEFGYKVTVFDEKQCESVGLHALLAVGRGSMENPPRFIIMEYKAENASKTIGLVGKGVTFDTGGISIKPDEGMNYMKSDMGGAAAVFGTMEMAAKLQLPIHLIGIVPTTENCVDSWAIKPGDVIQSYSGKTIEVINTDAEGRLILADGLFYMKKHFNPDTLIDLATLTGSCIRALGYAAAGLLSNDDSLANELYDAGQKTGEKLWRLPLWDDYADMMKSDIADIKNLSTAPLAGAISAAKFLEVFIDKHPRWAHLDIAGTAFGDSEFGSMKSATAFGIRLLTDWLRGR